jgi:hypothetical protein
MLVNAAMDRRRLNKKKPDILLDLFGMLPFKKNALIQVRSLIRGLCPHLVEQSSSNKTEIARGRE